MKALLAKRAAEARLLNFLHPCTRTRLAAGHKFGAGGSLHKQEVAFNLPPR